MGKKDNETVTGDIFIITNEPGSPYRSSSVGKPEQVLIFIGETGRNKIFMSSGGVRFINWVWFLEDLRLGYVERL